MQIREKLTLREKGEVAALPTVRQLVVTLKWSSSVDLDLMAFYESADGTVGGIYTSLLGGPQGDLNKFPWIALDKDSGVSLDTSSKQEVLKIFKLDGVKKIYLVALNYTDAKANNLVASFSNYNGLIEVVDESGKAFEVPLKDQSAGVAALIATIDNSSPIGATIKREDRVMSLQELVTSVPGANALL